MRERRGESDRRSGGVAWLAAGLLSFGCAATDGRPATDMRPATGGAPEIGERAESGGGPIPGPGSEATPSSRPVEWGYRGELSPDRWAGLSPAYEACRHVGTQSPIDLPGDLGPGDTVRIEMDYRPSGLRIAHHRNVTDILDDGHTIQVTVEEGSQLTTPRDVYALRQFHFHSPSEHSIDGRIHPLEVHFVHRSPSGRFAVLAALIDRGEANPNLARLIEHFPPERGAVVHRPEIEIDPGAHFAKTLSALTYAGSFTTPPCTEDVEWLVLDEPLTASSEQIEKFAEKLEGNARPVQPRGSRTIGRRSLARMGGD